METFTALSDPSRRKIVELLANGERSVSEINCQFTMSASAVSQHLKVLKTSGVVYSRVSAQKRLYGLNERALNEAAAWIQDQVLVWSLRLNALEDVLNEEDRL